MGRCSFSAELMRCRTERSIAGPFGGMEQSRGAVPGSAGCDVVPAMKLVKPDVSITQLAPASVAGPAADDGLRVTHQPRRATEAKVADHLDFTAVYPSLFVLAERAAMKIVQDRATAEDVAADTMVRALASWGKVRGYARPWVTRVAVNRAIDV